MASVTTAQSQVLRELRKLIATGALEPGQQIIQDSLASALGVSRVPLREALKVLEGEGHVSYHPHRGYFVADLSVADLTEVYRIRALLEAEALLHAVPLLTTEDIEHLQELADNIVNSEFADDVMAVSDANRRFHFAIFEASNMPRLVRMIRTLWESTDAYRSVYMSDPENIAQMDREHQEMMAAIAVRDTKKVIDLQSAHRENSVAVVSRVISRS
ncbi:MAG: FCD domain-containing protein [Actinobacteria bacterium]|uniref:Unannotated protein n=1 Tax=freshwater metagenome TaxID=449393 RepID=A0A6J5ZND4_9ZZZZ|nr:FCD domain-containing protein [Actinomycetota bacterium]